MFKKLNTEKQQITLQKMREFFLTISNTMERKKPRQWSNRERETTIVEMQMKRYRRVAKSKDGKKSSSRKKQGRKAIVESQKVGTRKVNFRVATRKSRIAKRRKEWIREGER